jgi:transposase-like protein
MGRPKGGKNKQYSFEYKLLIVNEYVNDHESYSTLVSKYRIVFSVIHRWVRIYLDKGEEGLKGIHQRKGNPYAALHTSRKLSEIERLRLELMKKDIEIERLKKGYIVKGVGLKKEYVTCLGKTIK